MQRLESEVTVPQAEVAATSSSRWRGELRVVADLLAVLTQSDLRFRYGRGKWQFLRWLFDPFAAVGIYLILITVVLDRPGEAPGLSLAAAVVPFQLVMLSVGNAMGAVTIRRPIILNMAFRRSLIPLSSVLTESVAFGASFIIIVMMMAIYRVAPTPALLWLPVLLLTTIALAASFSYPASLFGVWFRELRNLGISFVRTLFFLGPGLVPLSQTGGTAYDLLKLNPLTGIFEAYRDVFYYGQSPAAWEILYPLGFAVVFLGLFVPLYRQEQKQFAKVVDS
jgi:ABC-type polysaccharide/polyol phosphate export permease